MGSQTGASLDRIDRAIINGLQGGFPVCTRPFAAAAENLGLEEDDLIRRIDRLLEDGVLTRFGPLFHAEKMGGGLMLAAMAVPEERFDEVTAVLDGLPEVAHNYERTHKLNMWFVLATEHLDDMDGAVKRIEDATGLAVVPMPKHEEFFVGLHFDV